MAKVELKAPIIDEIKGHVSEAKAAVIVNYCGITVEQDTALRKKLREAGVVYKVYKNTFLKRAFEGSDFAQLDNVLEGPTAVAFSSDDATAPARILAEVMKDVPALTFKAGVIDGTYYDEAGCKLIATIPSRDELISKLLGSLQSPITNFARVMNQLAEKGGAAACDVPVKEEAKAEEAAPAEEAKAEEAPAAEAKAEEAAPAEEAKAEEAPAEEAKAE